MVPVRSPKLLMLTFIKMVSRAALVLGILLMVSLAQPTWAQRNPFDAAYTNCPAHLRLGALTGVVVRHPREDGDLRTDQLEVIWDIPEPTVWHTLGDWRYVAQITVIAHGPGDPLVRHSSLGSGSVLFQDTALASEWKVWVAITAQQHVISDIAGGRLR